MIAISDNPKIRAAFFDIDGTLAKGFIICAFPEYLVQRGAFAKESNEDIRNLLQEYKSKKTTYRHISIEIPKKYALGIKGQSQETIRSYASGFIGEYWKNVYPYSKALVELMNAHGVLTIGVSGSPIEPIEELASALGLKEIHGTEMSVRNGIYDGIVKRNLIIREEKEKLFDEIVSTHNIDCQSSFGFGDTEQDIAILGKVGHPIPLNPNLLLLEHAMKNGWRILKNEELLTEVSSEVSCLKRSGKHLR